MEVVHREQACLQHLHRTFVGSDRLREVTADDECLIDAGRAQRAQSVPQLRLGFDAAHSNVRNGLVAHRLQLAREVDDIAEGRSWRMRDVDGRARR